MPPQVLLALVLFASLISAAAQSNGRIIAAYVSDWSGFKANAINYTIVTNVHYCFANLDTSGNVIVPSGLTADFIDTVHRNGAVISLTIGGWGTTPFSRVFSTSAGIANATNSISKVMTQFGLDGVEIDWEFPGAAGAVGAMFDTAMDTSNYLTFLKALRLKLGTKAIISACGIITTFIGSNGLPLVSTTEFAKVLNFISIMAYDINGAWNTYSGPNAPLQPDSSGKNAGSVGSGINNWVKSGFPLNQIVLATAFYGRGTIVSASMENNDGTNVAALVTPAYKSRDSSYTYIKVLRFLQDTTGYYVSKYDSITQTPWLYHKPTMEFISYENPLSISVKSQYAGCLGLLGISCWDISLDGGQLLPYLTGINTPNGTDCLAKALAIKKPLSVTVPPLPAGPTDPTIRCGTTWVDANSNCNTFCNNDGDCMNSQYCYKQLTNVCMVSLKSNSTTVATASVRISIGSSSTVSTNPPSTTISPLPSTPSDPTIRCGATWVDANSNCHTFCNTDGDCSNTQHCYRDLVNLCIVAPKSISTTTMPSSSNRFLSLTKSTRSSSTESANIISTTAALLPATPSDPTIRCGTTWVDANSNCHTFCNADSDCSGTQHCYRDLANTCVGAWSRSSISVSTSFSQSSSSPSSSSSPTATNNSVPPSRTSNFFATSTGPSNSPTPPAITSAKSSSTGSIRSTIGSGQLGSKTSSSTSMAKLSSITSLSSIPLVSFKALTITSSSGSPKPSASFMTSTISELLRSSSSPSIRLSSSSPFRSSTARTLSPPIFSTNTFISVGSESFSKPPTATTNSGSPRPPAFPKSIVAESLQSSTITTQSGSQFSLTESVSSNRYSSRSMSTTINSLSSFKSGSVNTPFATNSARQPPTPPAAPRISTSSVVSPLKMPPTTSLTSSVYISKTNSLATSSVTKTSLTQRSIAVKPTS